MMGRNRFVWRAPHHLYVGAAFIVFGLVFDWLCEPYVLYGVLDGFWLVLMVLGGVLVVDDVFEHFVTRDTPVRLLFERVVVPWLRRR